MSKTKQIDAFGMKITLLDNSDEVLAALENAIKRGAKAIGEEAVTNSKEIITKAKAVDTGRLRNSVTYDSNDKEIVIGTNVEYAAGIELGTHRKKGAVRFLQKSVADYKGDYKDIMKRSLKNA